MNKSDTAHFRENYGQYIRQKILIIVILAVLTFLAALFALCNGSVDIPTIEVLKALLRFEVEKSVMVTLGVRMPRVYMAIISGIGLALAGCSMQSILKNPMASASTLGISQGATFGAAIAITYFGAGKIIANTSDAVTISNPIFTSICAFIGSMVVTFVILGLSKYRKTTPPMMILAGVALSSLFSGATTLLQYFSTDTQMSAIVFWTFGDLGRVNMKEVGIVVFVTSLSFAYFLFNSWNYNSLESGEDTARGLGVHVSRVRLTSMVIASLNTAIIVSFVGTINFIGLIAPHIVRRFIGNDYRYLLPASAFMGALLLIMSDTFARLIISPVILPIGAITSFLGAPLFLYLIYKGAGSHAKS